MIKPTTKQRPFGIGLIASAILHVLVLGLVVLGLPVFWEPEPLPEAIGVQLAQLSDITAAPKSSKVNNEKIVKKPDAPKVDQPKKEEPKKETPPPPPNPQPAAAPPPPQPEAKPTPTPPTPKEEEAQKIPDPEKKPEEKKPEEKKPEEKKPEKKVEKKPDEKKKPDKQSAQDFNNLLNNVLKETPAPDTQEKTKKQATPAPAEQSEGPQTSQFSEIPLTASETDGIAAQVEPNWNTTSFMGAADVQNLVVLVSVSLAPDGTIDPTSVTVSVNDPRNPYAQQVVESCKRAILITKQLKLPPGKTYARMSFRFPIADLH